MIDHENEIFSYCAKALREVFKGIYVVGETISSPPKFPAVSIIEISNSVYEDSIDCCSYENHIRAMYEIDVYSNLTSGKKKQAKKIMNMIDEKLSELGCIRTFCQPMDNLSDISIYRLKARYEAIIGKDNYIYTK